MDDRRHYGSRGYFRKRALWQDKCGVGPVTWAPWCDALCVLVASVIAVGLALRVNPATAEQRRERKALRAFGRVDLRGRL